MLDTTTLEAMYEEMMDAWMELYSSTLLGGYMVCDVCHLPSENGKFYPVHGGNGVELLVCQECFNGFATSAWREL